ncbi:MAG TPA: hypothetical protein DCE78_00305 [Bacteroidetes bacterium]|nr:hypothetical protein [Bacteroidota bacterium]
MAFAFGCGSTSEAVEEMSPVSTMKPITEYSAPSPDPRVGLSPGLFDAAEAIWNLKLVSTSPTPEDFIGAMNTDLAFKDNYAIQGNYNGFIVWDISNPAQPVIVKDFLCPASQSDVSVYGDLLFVSGEGLSGRLDCGTEGVQTAVSDVRLRGIRIFDISDIQNPKYISNVQTCRGSHTHSVLVDPNDDENVYVYISGSAPVRPEDELPGCSNALPSDDPNSALFRIEVIQVPLDDPTKAAIVSSPRIFEDLTAPPTHGPAPEEILALEKARAEGAFIAEFWGQERVVSNRMITPYLEAIMKERNGTEITAADSATLRERLPALIAERFGSNERSNLGPDQCHDITLYPELGIAGGACEGYGILLDISDPVNPVRLDAVADSNFSYWHSATFNNDGTTVIFTDEWGGGTQAKCRATDPYEWGANAIFTIEDGKMKFQSYYKMDAPQTSLENCVAHNGSLIPVPGRDLMVQGWYQGGIVILDFTDPANPVEIAYHDRGPVSPERMETGGSWSIYWYNGTLVNSEIARGLDIFEVIPSDYLTENEIAAAKTVYQDYLNAQGQPKFVWPATPELALAYLDQLERDRQMDLRSIVGLRTGISQAKSLSGSAKTEMLNILADSAEGNVNSSKNSAKVKKLADTLRALATM